MATLLAAIVHNPVENWREGFTMDSVMRARLVFLLLLTCIASLSFGQKDRRKQLNQAPDVKAEGKPLYANSHALIIGINKYKNLPANSQLAFAANDATALRDILVKSYGFPAQNVILLLDEQATLANIRDSLSTFADAKKVGEDDRVLIYFSGHGQTVATRGGGEMGYLIPSDAQVDLSDPTNSASYLRTCLPMRSVWDYLAASPAKHGLIIADACFSGLLTATKGAISMQTANVLLTRRARQVLTGGSKGETTIERSDLGHGIFTAKLLDELKARSNQPGTAFTVSDLYAALYSEVSTATEGKQNPKLGRFEEEGEVLFAPGNRYKKILGAATGPQPATPPTKVKSTDVAANDDETVASPPVNHPGKGASGKPKKEPKPDDAGVPEGGTMRERPRIAVCPVVNTAGEAWAELRDKEIAKAQEYLQLELSKRGFDMPHAEVVQRTIQGMGVDLTDEEQQKRSNLFDIGHKLNADYVIFAVITETSQKKQARALYLDTEGQTTIKLWLLDVRSQKPILSAKTVVGRSGGSRLTIDNKGSDRQIQATANALRDGLKEFLSRYPVIKG